MPLIACPDCATQVSDRAPTCPKCGAPIANRPDVVATGTPLTTTQLTSKRLKAQIVWSSLCFWVGLVWLIFSMVGSEPGSGPSFIPVILLLIGTIWYVSTRYRIWWHHK